MLGLDIGFGDVKAVVGGNSGGPPFSFKFPTAICYVKNGVGELGEFTGSRKEYLFDGKRYLLGKAAMFGAFSTRSMDFLSRFAPLFAFRASQNSGAAVSRLAVGLPIAYYNKANRTTLKKALCRIDVNREVRAFEVNVYPQAYGALADYRFDEFGNAASGTAISGLVLDIGFNTVDVLAFERGMAVTEDMGMLERQGISVAVRELARRLQVETTINLSEQEAKEVLRRKKLRIYGRVKDVSEAAGSIMKEYADWLLNEVASTWDERLKRADRLIIAGGGAYYIKDHIPSKYGEIVYIPSKPEYANARGFFKILRANSEPAGKGRMRE